MPRQHADPDVSRRKFEREITEYRMLEHQYRQRGWFLIHAAFPEVVVMLTAPKLKPPAVVMGVRFDYTNYDAVAPSVQLVNPFTNIPYTFKELPTKLERALPAQHFPVPGAPQNVPQLMIAGEQPYMQAYGADETPFFCLPGVREYHEHPGHNGDSWELHRTTGAGRLVRLLDVIHRYGTERIVGYGVQLVPQIGMNFGPPPL